VSTPQRVPGKGSGPAGTDHSATRVDPGGRDSADGVRASDDRAAYIAMQRSPEFIALRRRFRRFVFPMTVAFLVWYFTYVLLAAYATDFFAQRVAGNINVGLLFGLGQFLTTALITIAYIRWADRELDPAAEDMREQVERVVAGGAR